MDDSTESGQGLLGLPGDVARDLAKVDWSSTPLGTPDRWPSSLRMIVRTMLSSRFSMWLAWGPERVFFCNDAYRRDTLGKKYPWALGRSAREVWAEIWPEIGPRIDAVFATGAATWDEALLLFLERSGFREETYHTFSYSPVYDEEGNVAAMLCVVSEDTERVVGERRMSLLRELGGEATIVRTESEFFGTARRHLERADRTLPFTLCYVFDEHDTARLGFTTGFGANSALTPPVLRFDDETTPWPVADVAGGRHVDIDLSSLAAVPCGGWDEPPEFALAVPIPQQGHDTPLGMLVVGANRYRPLDADYRGYVELVAGQIGAGIASARAYDSERRRADALAELDRAKTAFFTNISHEFRTPLTLLLGPAEDALTDAQNPLPEPQHARMQTIHRNGQRLLKLVNSLLDFSRLESGRLTARYEPVELARESRDLASMFYSAVERVGLTLTIDAGELDEPVYVDREMWAKILFNLLSNALKFTFEGGITVSLQAAGREVELRVTDTGTGIPENEQTRLFERFHRIDGARSRTHEGSGIGLALVAELTRLHGGSVGVTSRPGRGSTFFVRIPFGSAHLPRERVSDVPTPSASHTRAAEGFLVEAARWTDDGIAGVEGEHAGMGRILVADDNADMRDYIVRLLAPHYAIDVAGNGAEAFKKALEHPPDLVLTDVMMPELDGFGLLARLRQEPSTRGIPVVMLSARAGDDATLEGLDAGADDYLVKPFSARELLARVRANLELDRVRRNREQLEHNRMLLDQAQRLARVGSWEIDLETGAISGSDEFYRQVQIDAERLATIGMEAAMSERMHPDDIEAVQAALRAAIERGEPLAYEARLIMPGGDIRTFRAIGELERDEQGRPVRLRGSNQDITDQRKAEVAIAEAAAAQEAAIREHRIADELQRSLLPPPAFDPEQLSIATYYRAGVVGAQVGGDWYDIIELGAGRTALVMGDVMGHGVRAAAVMGQLRAAIRAYAQLDLAPGTLLDMLDRVVRELDEAQIVTCVYAVYDPVDGSLTYASAGHVPPIVARPGKPPERLTGASGPPLGTGMPPFEQRVSELPPGTIVTFYTDGLVERRGEDIELRIDDLADLVAASDAPLEKMPLSIVQTLVSVEPDDDIALLMVQTHGPVSGRVVAIDIPPERSAVHAARAFVTRMNGEWGVSEEAGERIVLLTSELVTNALLHGKPPIRLIVRYTGSSVVLDVRDAGAEMPHRMRATALDEDGRGLQMVSVIAARWGSRPAPEGKSVWAIVSLSPERGARGRAGDRSMASV